MRLVPPVVAPLSSLSWPESSPGLILSGLLASDTLSDLSCQKACNAYEHGWSKCDEGATTTAATLIHSSRQPHMTAREQCGGIEKLVDELCAKLKQIQDGETEAPQSPRPSFALVLQDMHDSHYSGYPSLGLECSVGDIVTGDSWSDDCCYSDTWLLHNNNNDNESSTKKNACIGGGGAKYFYQHKDPEFLRVLAENRHNTLTSSFNDNNDEDLDMYLDASNEDPSLARLIAKFDRTVEALWSPDSMVLDDKSPQVDSQVFISSGTNLTSSIWSDTSLNDKEQSFTSRLVETEKIVGDRSKGIWCDEMKEEKIKNAWNNIENTDDTKKGEEKSWQIGYGLGILSQQLLEGENESQQNSLNLINHHREKSVFTEVRKSNIKTSWESEQKSSSINIAIERSHGIIIPEEEDLLTSAKTHFRPIKQNSVESNTSTSLEAIFYEDGTTFKVSSSLDKPPFTRSASGTLYLNTATNSPKKYMPYTEKEPYSGKYGTNGFIPKFAIRKIEKGIQTDLDPDESDIEEDKGFYFPEDEGEFADNIDCPADIEDEGEDDTDDDDDDSEEQDNDNEEEEFCVEQWREKKWSVNDQAMPTWSDAKWSGGGDGSGSWFQSMWLDGSTEASKPSARLREELSEEGEQLFADIQYLQQLILGDCWISAPNQDEEEQSSTNQGVHSYPPQLQQPMFPEVVDWRLTERTYDDLAAETRNTLDRSAGLTALWECPGPRPPSPKFGGL